MFFGTEILDFAEKVTDETDNHEDSGVRLRATGRLHDNEVDFLFHLYVLEETKRVESIDLSTLISLGSLGYALISSNFHRKMEAI